jgi:alpha-beta hydrolase superfamily lysophospholipase
MFKPSFLINHEELQAKHSGIQGKIKSIDGFNLAYIAYIPNHPKSCILFYHGGGANNLDYTKMAESLCNDSQIATFLFDIRGHGKC